MFDRPIRFAAQQDPFSVAVSNGADHVSYAALDRIVDQAADALERAGVAAPADGERVLAGVCVRDPYLHLLMILACCRIGVATTSLLIEHAQPMIYLARPTIILADDPALDPAVRIDKAWLDGVIAGPHVERPLRTVDPQALGRVQFSSGSTGLPKAVAFTWGVTHQRVQHTWMRPTAINRMLSLVGPASGSLPIFLSTLARGGCVLFGPADPAALARALPVLRPDGILAAPSQLAALLDALPTGIQCLPDLQITLGAARADERLCRRAERLLGKVSVTYASTEGGVLTFGYVGAFPDDRAVGYVVPWAELEIVDADDRPVAVGEEGRIRVRGADVVDAYLGQEGETDDRFRDGWFYSGDLGSLAADGLVRVHGREDEVMNLGGEKHLPDTLEDRARTVAGVADVAAFALSDKDGVDQPWLAVVKAAGAEVDERALGSALAPLGLPSVRVAWIAEIPRTPLGKIARDTLRTAARALAG